MKILLTWIGLTDIRAAECVPEVGAGPIGQAVESRHFDRILLLSNFDKKQTAFFQKWLARQTKTPLEIKLCNLSSPTEFGEIYQSVIETITELNQKNVADLSLTFHLSPGTPAMAAVWVIVSKTRFPAELIESSKQAGVKTVSVPFEISAEFIPNLIRQTDELLEKVSGENSSAAEFGDIIFQSPQMRDVVEQAQIVARHNVPVLIEGESGTGKELFARAIHLAGERKNKSFVAVNCGAIPSELVESELFGHIKGAFTGADKKRDGYFKEADGGTIFLDEIGELPLRAQVRLLRVLQEKEIVPVGTSQPEKIDVRVISATNRNLLAEVADGNFREDLFYRLAVFPLFLAPLRKREGDVGLLINRFFDKLNRENTGKFWKQDKRLSAGAKNALLGHRWTGNVRELQNTILRIAIASKNETISESDVQKALFTIKNKNDEEILNQPLGNDFNLPELLSKVARHYLDRALVEAKYNKTRAAKLLGLPNYQTFDNWLKKYQ
jgi:transcriptional regulator with PAS, ATPase and Fis domain